jgi:hypothetical protein
MILVLLSQTLGVRGSFLRPQRRNLLRGIGLVFGGGVQEPRVSCALPLVSVIFRGLSDGVVPDLVAHGSGLKDMAPRKPSLPEE